MSPNADAMVGYSPTRHQSAETAHPLRGGVAKPRVSPQREDCRVTEQVRCPVTGMELRRYCDSGIYCSDGTTRPSSRAPRARVVHSRRDAVEGGGGAKRKRWDCSAGEWGAATAAPFLAHGRGPQIRRRHHRRARAVLSRSQQPARHKVARSPGARSAGMRLHDARGVSLSIPEVFGSS